VGALPVLEREADKLLALKELPEDLRTLEEFEGRETVERLDELLRVTLELEDLEELEGLELLTLELEDLEELEGLELLTLELEDLEELEGLELLTLELEDREELEGLETLARELEDLEELEALEGAELLETDRLLPLALLDLFAVTGPASNIKAKVTDSRISLTFFVYFRVFMAFLLYLAFSFRFILNPNLLLTVCIIIKLKIYVKKRHFRSFLLCCYAPVPYIKGTIHMSGNTNSTSKSPFFQYFMGAFGRPILLVRSNTR
jgi:hypothetical protein